MRKMGAASLVAVCGMLAFAPARADTVPPFKGNDTGGIIAYSLTRQTDIRDAGDQPLRVLRQSGEIPRGRAP